MTNALSPGNTVRQIDNGSNTPPQLASAYGAILAYAKKGPVGVPIPLTGGDTQAEAIFGMDVSSPSRARMLESVRHAFLQGSEKVYGIRYIGAGSATASRMTTTLGPATSGSISSSVGAFPAVIPAGKTFSGAVNGGGPAVATVTGTKAFKVGAAATYAAVTASHVLNVTLNDGVTQVITFAGTENTQALFLQAINDQLLGGRAINSGGQIRLETDEAGSAITGSIPAGSDADVLTSLGLAAGAFTAGTGNVANDQAVLASELATLFEAAYAGSTSVGDDTTGTLTWSSDTTGGASSVQFTAGTGVAYVAGFDNALHSGVASSAVNTLKFEHSYGEDLSPGVWGNFWTTQVTRRDKIVCQAGVNAAGATSSLLLASTNRLAVGDTISIEKAGDTQRGVIQSISGDTVTLSASVTVPGGGYSATEEVVLETFDLTLFDETGAIVSPSPWRNLRMSSLAGANYVVNRVNKPQSPVFVTDQSAAPSDKRPSQDSSPVLFSGGADGAAAAYTAVVSAMDNFDKATDIAFVLCPGAAEDFSGAPGESIVQALESYAAGRPGVQALVGTPLGIVALGAGGYREWLETNVNLGDKAVSVLWPWVQRLDPFTQTLTLYPPEPFWLGRFAKTHKNAPNSFGQAAAGITWGLLVDVDGLEVEIGEGSAEYDDFYLSGGNAILNFPGEGICIYGNRTMDTTGSFFQLNVQIVFNQNDRLVTKALRWLAFEPNDADTRARVVKNLTALFRAQRERRILKGASDAEAFYIICDETNNSPQDESDGKMKIRVGLAVTKSAEFIETTLELDTRALAA